MPYWEILYDNIVYSYKKNWKINFYAFTACDAFLPDSQIDRYHKSKSLKGNHGLHSGGDTTQGFMWVKSYWTKNCYWPIASHSRPFYIRSHLASLISHHSKQSHHIHILTVQPNLVSIMHAHIVSSVDPLLRRDFHWAQAHEVAGAHH